jgi:hypothetical protein
MAFADWRAPVASGDETVLLPGGALLDGRGSWRLAWPAGDAGGETATSPEAFTFTAEATRLLPPLLRGRDVFEAVNAMGGGVGKAAGRWAEIDTPEDLARAREAFGE